MAEIWTSLEERTEGLQRHRMESWSLLSSERYGLPEEQAWSMAERPKHDVLGNLLKI